MKNEIKELISCTICKFDKAFSLLIGWLFIKFEAFSVVLDKPSGKVEFSAKLALNRPKFKKIMGPIIRDIIKFPLIVILIIVSLKPKFINFSNLILYIW